MALVHKDSIAEHDAPPHTQTTYTAPPLTEERVGFYLWGGPGTIRIIEVKYFTPRMDRQSIMTCYDYDYLARAQALFGITDCWVTYSWGS